MERLQRAGSLLLFFLAAVGVPANAWAQKAENQRPAASVEEGLVQLDFNDVELSVVIDTIARLTGKNFIYDDRVRGRVTIVSPTKVSVDQAYRVFESVLQVKGFTTVEGPGGALKVIPLREAKESPVDTRLGRHPTPASDRYVTRLIPLRYIDAEAISNTLKPLVSKDASMVSYAPTNTMILTDAASNIRRILSILDTIDVETYKEELAVFRLKHADASTLAQQLSEIFGGEITSGVPTPTTRRRTRRGTTTAPAAAAVSMRGTVRFLTDERTNALLVMASRSRLQEIRELVRKLDVPVTGGGRIQVYYLKHADAEEIAQTLNNLVSGQSGAVGARAGQQAQPQALRAAVTELAGGASVTADPPTNSLVIQASPEGYQALVSVIELLDIPRPQVLVEALIMEVDVTDAESLGFNGIVTVITDGGGNIYTVASSTQSLAESIASARTGGRLDLSEVPSGFLAQAVNHARTNSGTFIEGVIQASATDNSTNLISAPHILTSDNEEAEILVGDNIPIVTSRVRAATGVATDLSSSVNVERQDIGVTLRVTPQISEGDTVRLQIFQEITQINAGLTGAQGVGNPEEVGVALTNRKIENTVVVNDAGTVVIGGLISDDYQDRVTKVPFLGDIPILGWAFKTTTRSLTKKNLLVFLTPHIIRNADDLEHASIRKREEFSRRSEQALGLEEEDGTEKEVPEEELGLLGSTYERNPARAAIVAMEKRHPLERMREIERLQAEQEERKRAEEEEARHAPQYGILAGVFRDASAAQRRFTELLDAGYEGSLVSGETAGAVQYEIRLGPYEALEEAERNAEIVRESFGLSPQVVVERGEAAPPGEEP
jgi:general secretion pathway protein D